MNSQQITLIDLLAMAVQDLSYDRFHSLLKTRKLGDDSIKAVWEDVVYNGIDLTEAVDFILLLKALPHVERFMI